jgi:hypothetical protein
MVCIVTSTEETTSGYGEIPVYFLPPSAERCRIG